jgi:UDP-N-acetylglucosamine--N-acetylmuramyl-(pentapeptide) pyrophosphoryl-undecaprenol N-acetylglucosamine transferase
VLAAGGAIVVTDEDCTPDWVRGTLLPLLADPARLAAMGTATAALGRPDADELLADLVLEAAATRTEAGP